MSPLIARIEHRFRRRVASVVLLSFLGAACSAKKQHSSGEARPQSGPSEFLSTVQEPVGAELHHVRFHTGPDIPLQIHELRGELIPTRTEVPVTFDDPGSFYIKIFSGEIGITPEALADLMNRYVLAYPYAPLRNMRISIERGRLKQKGTLMKGAPIPFELEGDLSSTPDGLLSFHPLHIKSAHIPVKGMMDLFGLKMTDLINLDPRRGMRVQGDVILFDPQRIVPPPRIQGKIAAVRLESNEIIQVFGGGPDKDSPNRRRLSPPYPGARNGMYFRGGTLRFGKLTMRDADLQIIDPDPGDYFDFNLKEYNRQLVAGYTKNTLSYGLTVFMPDFHRLGSTQPRGKE